VGDDHGCRGRAALDELFAATGTLPPPNLVALDLRDVDLLSAAGVRALGGSLDQDLAATLAGPQRQTADIAAALVRDRGAPARRRGLSRDAGGAEIRRKR
jgi:hypothetical protein